MRVCLISGFYAPNILLYHASFLCSSSFRPCMCYAPPCLSALPFLIFFCSSCCSAFLLLCYHLVPFFVSLLLIFLFSFRSSSFPLTPTFCARDINHRPSFFSFRIPKYCHPLSPASTPASALLKISNTTHVAPTTTSPLPRPHPRLRLPLRRGLTFVLVDWCV